MFLVHAALTDRIIHKVSPASLGARRLYQSHYPTLASHPAKDAFTTYYKRNNIGASREMTIIKLAEIVLNASKVALKKQQSTLELSTAKWPTAIYCVGRSWTIFKMLKGNQFVLIMTGPYTQFRRFIQTPRISVLHFEKSFMGKCKLPHGTSENVLTDNRTDFISRLYYSPITILDTEHLKWRLAAEWAGWKHQQDNNQMTTRRRCWTSETLGLIGPALPTCIIFRCIDRRI